MYKQTVEKPALGPVKAAITVVLFIVAVLALYVFFSIVNTGIDPLAASAGVLVILMVLGYFILKPAYSTYTYTLEDNVLILQQTAARRVIREALIKKDSITRLTKGKGGIRFGSGKELYTFIAENKKYTFKPDAMLLALLNGNSFTDCYIDANFDALLKELTALIAIPSVKEAPTEGMPFGRPCAEALSYTLSLCKGLGMEVKNIDNYCGWAEIGQGEKLIGVLCHLDVVPAGDGWNSDPFKAVVTDDEIIGRGAIDDKGPAVAAIYSLAAINEAHNGKLPCRIRLIFGCDEESGWACMDRYSKTEDIPHMAFTPDAEYPVIITEKGIAHFNITTSLSEGEYQLYLKGGLRPNMVPDKASATVIGNIDRLFNILNDYDAHSHGISFSVKGDTLEIEALGAGAHGSTPEKGKNAFFELFKLLKKLDLKGSQGEFVDNIVDIFVDKLNGCGAGLKLSDELSGDLSLNFGMCFVGKNGLFPYMTDDSCRMVIDVRYPVSYTIKDISARLQAALPHSWECEIDHAQAPHHVDEGSALVQTLLDVYKTYTGRADKPIAIGGGTYARTLPGKAVAFGAQLPGRPDKAHRPNESIMLDDLKLSAKMFACALERLAAEN